MGFTSPQPENKHSSFAKRFWEWSGFGKKTLWDILQFLAIFIPLVTFVADQRAKDLDREESYQKEIKLAQEETLSDYLDEIKEFLLNGKLNQPTVRIVVRAETFGVLRQLDGEQRGELLRFLYEADLIGHQCQIDRRTLETTSCQEPFFELNGARLDRVTFDTPLILRGIGLQGASLVDAKLSGFDLSNADIIGANLKNADLSGTLLTDAQMQRTYLEGANLECAFLIGADLTHANLTDAKLQKADLREVDLTKVSSLQGASFEGATYNEKTIFPTGFDKGKEGMQLYKPDEPVSECVQAF